MTSPLRQLLNLLTESVGHLEDACAAFGTAIPDLYTPFHPESEAFRHNPKAAEAADIICAAALQIEAILAPPPVSLYHIAAGQWKSMALRVALESHVTEILREAGPDGLHVNDIAAKNGLDPRKLTRFLRYLAIHHVYRELRPDVFTNTRISTMLDTLKPSEEIIANPETKDENAPGLTALVGHHLDESCKAAAYAWETLSDPLTGKSGNPREAPLQRAFNTSDSHWEFIGREERLTRRFNIAMQNGQALQPDVISTAYDWKDLPAGSVIVDVGGGIGTWSLKLAREFPDLEFVVQDLSVVIEDAEKLWKTTLPNVKVTLEVQDFFKPQPERNVSVFLMKSILHDWSDEYAVKILAHLRTIARPDTKLILIEFITSFACHDPGADDDEGIPGSVPREAPAPLLANYGAVNELTYLIDMDMFVLFNSQERTIRHFDELLLSTGWKIKRVRRREGASFMHSIEATPVEVPAI